LKATPPLYALVVPSAALWLAVLWSSWACVALYSDGSMFMLDVVDRGSFTNYDSPRSYALGLMQTALVFALWAGVTDLQWLSIWYSFGSLALPALLFQLALLRARDDGLLLGAVIAALAAVYMPGFLFSVGEYTTAYGIAIAAMTFACRRDPPRAIDGAVLVLLAVFAMRTYQIFFFLGPAIAVPVAWRATQALPWGPLLARRPRAALIGLMALPIVLARLGWAGTYSLPFAAALFLVAAFVALRQRPDLAAPINAALHLIAAALFFATSSISAGSVYAMGGPALINGLADDSVGLWRNVPSVLTLASLALLFAIALLAPRLLGGPWPWLIAALPLLPLAAFPFAQVRAWPSQPLITLHYLPRLLDGAVICGIVLIAWLRTLDVARSLTAFVLLETREVQRQGLVLLVALLVAALPGALYGAHEWRETVNGLRAMIRNQRGTIDVFALPSPFNRFFWDHADRAFAGYLSRALRGSPDDAAIKPPPDTGLNPVPELRRYWWRD
jgi:hypothetical protein